MLTGLGPASMNDVTVDVLYNCVCVHKRTMCKPALVGMFALLMRARNLCFQTSN